MATKSNPELQERPEQVKSLPKTHSKPPYRPLNLQPHEITALIIVLEDYLKDRQPSLLNSGKAGVQTATNCLTKGERDG